MYMPLPGVTTIRGRRGNAPVAISVDESSLRYTKPPLTKREEQGRELQDSQTRKTPYVGIRDGKQLEERYAAQAYSRAPHSPRCYGSGRKPPLG